MHVLTNFKKFVCFYMWQRDTETGRHSQTEDRQIDRQADRQTDRQTGWKTDKQADWLTTAEGVEVTSLPPSHGPGLHSALSSSALQWGALLPCASSQALPGSWQRKKMLGENLRCHQEGDKLLKRSLSPDSWTLHVAMWQGSRECTVFIH